MLKAKCPVCGSDMVEKEKQFSCSTAKWKKADDDSWENEGCNYSIRKNALERFGKSEITASEVETLLENEVVEVTLKSKDKDSTYQKNVLIDHQWGVKVDFNSNPGRTTSTAEIPEAPAPKDEDDGEPSFQDSSVVEEKPSEEDIPF